MHCPYCGETRFTEPQPVLKGVVPKGLRVPLICQCQGCGATFSVATLDDPKAWAEQHALAILPRAAAHSGCKALLLVHRSSRVPSPGMERVVSTEEDTMRECARTSAGGRALGCMAVVIVMGALLALIVLLAFC